MPSAAANATRSFRSCSRRRQRALLHRKPVRRVLRGQGQLGGERTIRERISALSTQGYIKYFRNAADYGLLSSGRTKFGYLCGRRQLRMPAGDVDTATGELPMREHTVLPTHYKCPFRRLDARREPRCVGLSRRTERPGGPMNIAQSAVGSAVANFTHFLANYPQLANPCQLEVQSDQGIAGNDPQLAVGIAANLPTGANPRRCWTFSLSPVGENSPSYYVGEGPGSLCPTSGTCRPPGLRSSAAIRAIDPGTGPWHPNRLGSTRSRRRRDQRNGILQASA